MKRLCFGLLGALIAVMLLAAVVLFFPPAFRFGLRTANRFLPVAVEIEAHRHVPGRLDLSGVRVERYASHRLWYRKSGGRGQEITSGSRYRQARLGRCR